MLWLMIREEDVERLFKAIQEPENAISIEERTEKIKLIDAEIDSLGESIEADLRDVQGV